MKGSRVQIIVNELQGEKIDIVKWNPEVREFVRNALAPAEINSISLNDEEHIIDVIVEDDQLSLAIGRRGQNVRLASMLTNWKVNIVSKSKLSDRVKFAVQNLLQLDNLKEALAQVLVQSGVMNIIDLASMDVSELEGITKLDTAEAQSFIDAAQAALENEEINNEPEEIEDIISASATPSRYGYIKKTEQVEVQGEEDEDGAKFSDAEKRLREELAAFKLK
jgi:N utilization substance protein A